MAPKEEPNQAEAVRPQGYRVGSVLTSRDPAHPENAPNGYLHHRLHVCPLTDSARKYLSVQTANALANASKNGLDECYQAVSIQRSEVGEVVL